MLIVMAVALILLFVLYKFGDKLQKKQLAQKEQMMAAAQPVTMLVIDKKFLPLKDANLPKQVLEQTPKRYQKAKLPIVKAKIGPQIMNLICDEAIYDEVPTKGEVKAMVSGIYIVSIKSIRGKKTAAAEEPAKKGLRSKMRARQAELQKQLNEEAMQNAKAKKEKNSKQTKMDAKKAEERAKKITDGLK